MESERRRHRRVPCRLPCEIEGPGTRSSGTARDLSAGGLCVQVPMEAAQGDVLQVVLRPAQGGPVSIEAIVWHAHRVRERSSGAVSSRLGLVLSSATDAFLELLRRSGGSADPTPPPTRTPTPAPAPEPAPAAEAAAEAPPALPSTDRFRVRVKLDGSARTRSIVVFADSDEEARRSALAETAPGWHVLEVQRA